MTDRTLKAVLIMETAQWAAAAASAGDSVENIDEKLKQLESTMEDGSGADKLVANQERVRESSGKTSEAVDDVGRSIEELDHQQLSLTEVETALGKVAEDASVKGEQIGKGLSDGVEKGVEDLPEKIKPTTERLPEPFGSSGDKAGLTFSQNFEKHRSDFTRFAKEFSDEFFKGFEGDTNAALLRVNELFNKQMQAGGFSSSSLFMKAFNKQVQDANSPSGFMKILDNWGTAAAREGVEVGDIFGNGIAGGLQNAFKLFASLPPEAQAAVAAAAAAAGLILGSGLMATAAAVILGSAGALGIGAAVVANLKDPGITEAFGDLKNMASDTFSEASHSMVLPIEGAIDTIGAAIDKAEPNLAHWFDALSPSVDRLANGVGILADDLAEGLGTSAASQAEVLNALADVLPIIGSGVKIFFDEIKNDGPEAAEAIKIIADFLSGMLILLGYLIDTGSEFFAFFVGGFQDTIVMVKDLVDILAKVYPSWQPIAHAVDDLTNKLLQQTGASSAAAGATDRYGKSAASAADQAKALSDAIEQNTTDYDNLVGANLNAASSALQFRNALAGVTQAAQDNGTSLDVNTDAGRKNMQQLLDTANAARSTADAIRQQTTNTEGATAGDAAFAQSLGTSAAQLYNTATAAGFNKGQVAALIAQMLGIPKSVITSFLTPGGIDAKALVDYINAHAVNKTVDIVYNERHYVSTQQIQPGHGGSDPGGYLGTIHHAATGAVFDAGVYSHGPIVFAEPQTNPATGGMELFLPRQTPDQGRARALVETGAHWFGGSVSWAGQQTPMSGGGYASASEIADRLAQRLAPLVGNVNNTFNQVESDPDKISEAIYWTLQAR